jgi:hypothetical protein
VNLNEKSYKIDFQAKLLTMLIQKYEKSKSFIRGEPTKQKPQIAIKNSPFKSDYDDEMDYRKKEWIHDVLMKLREENIVSIKWEKFLQGQDIAKVYLEVESLSSAYKLSGLEPKEVKLDQLRSILLPLSEHPWEWLRNWWTDVDAAMADRKAAGLDLDDLVSYKQLVEVLLAIAELEDDIPKRVLSQRLFHDTKHFERFVERRIIQLIRAHSDMEYESDTDVIQSVGIVEHPRSVLISGPLKCKYETGEVISLELFPGGIGLSRDTIQTIRISDLKAKSIVLIENLTSWHQWIAEKGSAAEIVIYTGGYPSRSLQLLFKKISDFIQDENIDLPIYHWGDMDVGGIRIFEYIRSNFYTTLIPLGMDQNSYKEHVVTGMDISSSYISKINQLIQDQRFVMWHGLLQLMLIHRKRIEQESMIKLPM